MIHQVDSGQCRYPDGQRERAKIIEAASGILVRQPYPGKAGKISVRLAWGHSRSLADKLEAACAAGLGQRHEHARSNLYGLDASPIRVSAAACR
jgi:hypothetical protein